ncbi:PAAR domain-containing protein [Paraburkholderia strydomiana]|uniref:PAAR domain-containing protein n=1 Tax=Paraburkholderia strydomiana TaxID=1245417 RepID=UPI001BEC58EE|nr:PAAR domain-containing protein [Paraburkholderia strydomiana]MBT2789162.1 PAAR domain-containing protein [Paraburkholderia strydomiana]
MSEQQERNGKLYPFATIGARTERGGCVTSGSVLQICGLPVACVGDIVTYSDASEAVIMDGAGIALVYSGNPVALVGSSLSNGDRIASTIWSERGPFVDEGREIEGFFDADYVPEPHEPSARFAVAGATTPRGGVLRDATGTYEVQEMCRKAARIGDFMEYPDGTRARIITGIGLPGKPDCAFGVVGSMLDNGDMINDSPHRDVRTSTVFVPVNEHGEAITRQ